MNTSDDIKEAYKDEMYRACNETDKKKVFCGWCNNRVENKCKLGLPIVDRKTVKCDSVDIKSFILKESSLGKGWIPDDWPTLCGALGSDSGLRVFCWYKNDATGEWIIYENTLLVSFISEIVKGRMFAAIKDPRVKI